MCFKKISKVFHECFNEVLFCNFVVAWISLQLQKQKKGLLSLKSMCWVCWFGSLDFDISQFFQKCNSISCNLHFQSSLNIKKYTSHIYWGWNYFWLFCSCLWLVLFLSLISTKISLKVLQEMMDQEIPMMIMNKFPTK